MKAVLFAVLFALVAVPVWSQTSDIVILSPDQGDEVNGNAFTLVAKGFMSDPCPLATIKIIAEDLSSGEVFFVERNYQGMRVIGDKLDLTVPKMARLGSPSECGDSKFPIVVHLTDFPPSHDLNLKLVIEDLRSGEFGFQQVQVTTRY